MWPGMRPATGWIANLHVDAALGQLIVELAHLVLRLRHRHAVAGHDDDAIGVGQELGDVLRRRALGGLRFARRGRRLHLAERAEQHVRERPVHRPAHDDRQDQARRAVERAGDDEQLVLEHEAHRHRRQPGVRVQQRDDRRHVGAADRQDQQHAEQRATAATMIGERPGHVRVDRQVDAGADRDRQQRRG